MDNIKLYGVARCHKTQHYIQYLKNHQVAFTFLDVEGDKKNAEELRKLFITKRLNFPTLLVKGKKLRNPYDSELEKCLIKKGLLNENV